MALETKFQELEAEQSRLELDSVLRLLRTPRKPNVDASTSSDKRLHSATPKDAKILYTQPPHQVPVEDNTPSSVHLSSGPSDLSTSTSESFKDRSTVSSDTRVQTTPGEQQSILSHLKFEASIASVSSTERLTPSEAVPSAPTAMFQILETESSMSSHLLKLRLEQVSQFVLRRSRLQNALCDCGSQRENELLERTHEVHELRLRLKAVEVCCSQRYDGAPIGGLTDIM